LVQARDPEHLPELRLEVAKGEPSAPPLEFPIQADQRPQYRGTQVFDVCEVQGHDRKRLGRQDPQFVSQRVHDARIEAALRENRGDRCAAAAFNCE
jgi:hypothetical protein